MLPQADCELISSEVVLVEDSVFPGLAYFSELCPVDDFEILLFAIIFLFDVDGLRIVKAGGKHLILDFLENLSCFFEGKRSDFGLLSAGEVLNGQVGQAQSPSQDQILHQVFLPATHQYIFTITIKPTPPHLNSSPIQIMFKQDVYHSNDLASLFPKQLSLFDSPYSLPTSERTLIVSALHMLLGLASSAFPKTNDSFVVNPRIPELPHIDRALLLNQLDYLAILGNKFALLRKSVQQISLQANRVLQAFGMGLHEVQRQIEEMACRKLLTVQQEAGILPMEQDELNRSQLHPIWMLGIQKVFEVEIAKLTIIQEIVSSLPSSNSANQEDANRSVIFLLNFYFHQCEEEYLTGRPFLLHLPFKRTLMSYLEICKAWISFDEAVVQSISSGSFFIDLTQALSLNGDRFFSISKILRKQMVPLLFQNHYRQMIQLGKTVQFIKYYLNEAELTLFYDFIGISTEFSSIETQLSSFNSPPVFTAPINRLLNTSISARYTKKHDSRDHRRLRFSQSEDDPYTTEKTKYPFLSLRPIQMLKRSNNPTKNPQQQQSSTILGPSSGNLNATISIVLGKVLNSLGCKCKAMMRQDKIKASIFQALRGIKQFVLVSQGDFIQEFLEQSEAILQKPTDKISPNNLQHIIEEAAKSSSCHSFYSEIKELLSFVFVRTNQSTLKGWRSFSFTLKSKPPVNFIFHAASMSDYENIGNLLFNLRKSELILVGLWRKSLLSGSASLQHLRSATHRFVISLQAFLFQEIEDLWTDLQAAFDQCKSILELLEANNELVRKLKGVTTENKALSNTLAWLIKVVQQLESVSWKLERGETEGVNSQIQQVWSWFLNLLDQARQIGHLSESFDFDFDFVSHFTHA